MQLHPFLNTPATRLRCLYRIYLSHSPARPWILMSRKISSSYNPAKPRQPEVLLLRFLQNLQDYLKTCLTRWGGSIDSIPSCYFFHIATVLIHWPCNSDVAIQSMTPSEWASCQVRKIAGCACAGDVGTFSPPPQVNDPDMHHDTCVMHMPGCMPGSLNSGFL